MVSIVMSQLRYISLRQAEAYHLLMMGITIIDYTVAGFIVFHLCRPLFQRFSMYRLMELSQPS